MGRCRKIIKNSFWIPTLVTGKNNLHWKCLISKLENAALPKCIIKCRIFFKFRKPEPFPRLIFYGKIYDKGILNFCPLMSKSWEVSWAYVWVSVAFHFLKMIIDSLKGLIIMIWQNWTVKTQFDFKTWLLHDYTKVA